MYIIWMLQDNHYKTGIGSNFYIVLLSLLPPVSDVQCALEKRTKIKQIASCRSTRHQERPYPIQLLPSITRWVLGYTRTHRLPQVPYVFYEDNLPAS